MFCTNCGKEQEGNPEYCQNCGAKLAQDPIVQPGMTPAVAGNYAGFWKRFAASIIDGILLNIVGMIIGLIVGDSLVVYYVISVCIGWLYGAIMESSSNQATLGKMVFKIVVTDYNGNRISFARATGRHFAKYVSTIILLIGFIMIGFTKKKQGLHDMIAETLVVVKK